MPAADAFQIIACEKVIFYWPFLARGIYFFVPAMMRLVIRLLQGLNKEIADYCDLQVEVIKEQGKKQMFEDQTL